MLTILSGLLTKLLRGRERFSARTFVDWNSPVLQLQISLADWSLDCSNFPELRAFICRLVGYFLFCRELWCDDIPCIWSYGWLLMMSLLIQCWWWNLIPFRRVTLVIIFFNGTEICEIYTLPVTWKTVRTCSGHK